MVDSSGSEGVVEAPRTVSPVEATGIGWLAVAIYNFGDIARLPLRMNALGVRVAHLAVDFGHVLAVALSTAGAVALFGRYGPRKRIWSTLAVALAAGALGPVFLSGDLEGAFDRLLPDRSSAFSPWAACIALGQAVTASFLLGRLCARPRLRWVSVGVAVSLIVANDFFLENGYPGAHVLLSSTGATLLAASLAGAARPRFARLETLRGRRGATLVALSLALLFAIVSVVRPPSNAAQIELLERDTTLLFPWLRPLYASKRSKRVAIPRELRHWFESRAKRPDVPPATERFLPDGPIVVLITIDALRFDVLEPRYRRAAPNLHEIRKNSVFFAQARSSGSDTRYSMATLFSGRHHSMLNWTARKGGRLTLERDRHARFPELLRDAGVQTVSVRTVTMLDPRLGIARGFEEEFRRETLAPNQRSLSDQVAEKVVERLRRQGPGPLFLYTHLLDPHDPYETYGKPAKSKFDAYLIDVSVADDNVGKIRRAIFDLGLKQRTALIIGADHGEGFGEHRILTHGKSFYDVLVHVPLMIEIPSVAPRTVDDYVALMDVGPTVLDFFSVPTPGQWVAESLTPFLAGRRGDPTRLILMEKPTHQAMLFPDGLKIMKRRGVYELYDVRRDPAENDNLWDELGEESPKRLGLLDAYVRVHSRSGRDDSE